MNALAPSTDTTTLAPSPHTGPSTSSHTATSRLTAHLTRHPRSDTPAPHLTPPPAHNSCHVTFRPPSMPKTVARPQLTIHF
mmetsp:Transcript_65729/g.143487  ORF Transcript_65729/g.143487 Transcript_65729/m.143487 type:complete len:81 (+) Transcript_65729:393-635(+)